MRNEKKQAIQIIDWLEKAGYKAYFVGGCVRDEEMQHIHTDLVINVNDYDLVTNATPEEIVGVLRGKVESINEIGKQFGVIKAGEIEIATFRGERYEISGKPKVHFVSSLKEDVSRRDFTVNGIGKDKNGKIYDYHNGIRDIEEKVIRFIGNPYDRIKDDESRILRGLELASRFGFQIEVHSKQAIMERAQEVEKVPKELVGKIINKAIEKGHFHRFIAYALDTNVFPVLFPFVILSHSKIEKIISKIEKLEMNDKKNAYILFSLLFQHSDGKDVYDYIQSLCLGKKLATEVAKTVEMVKKEEQSPLKELREIASLFKKKEDLCYFVPHYEKIKNKTTNDFKGLLENHIFYVSELNINGDDLIKIGIPKGKMIAQILHELVIENKKDKRSAIQYVKEKHLG